MLTMRARIWVIAGVAAGSVALGSGGATAGLALTSHHGSAVRRAAAAPAKPGADSKVGKNKATPSFAQEILKAGISASPSWIDQTGQTLVNDWKAGDTQQWTDQNVLLAAGVLPQHVAIFDRITEQYYHVSPPQGAPQAAPSPSASSTPSPSQSPSSVVLQVPDYEGTQPSMIAISGDDSLVITNITWQSWGSTTATGTGEWGVNDCNPDCAQGTVTNTPATIVLSNPQNIGDGDGGGWTQFETMIVTEAGQVHTYTYGTTDWPMGAS